jgi:transposase
LTDPQWEAIKENLPSQRKRKHDLRDIVDAILWILRTGSQWRNLPEQYPKWYSVYYYFRTWRDNGILEGLNNSLNMLRRRELGREPTPSAVAIDSQSVKTGPFVSGQTGVDGNKKVRGRKRHVVTDAVGLVWSVAVSAANVHDRHKAREAIEPILGYLDRAKKVFADQAYKKVLNDWFGRLYCSLEAEISSAPPSGRGFVPLKIRWVVEQAFGVFNFYRRLDKDHEKTANSAKAWIYWANCQRALSQLGLNTKDNF